MLKRFITLLMGKGEWHIQYFRDSGAEWRFEPKSNEDRSLWYVVKTFISDTWYLAKHSKKQW